MYPDLKGVAGFCILTIGLSHMPITNTLISMSSFLLQFPSAETQKRGLSLMTSLGIGLYLPVRGEASLQRTKSRGRVTVFI